MRDKPARVLGAALVVLFPALVEAQVAVKPQAVRSPKEVFGFEIGADRKLANWPEIVEYYRELGKASDRVDFAELGKTTLGKPFIALTVSAPENLKRLDYYRDIQRRLADPRHAWTSRIRSRTTSRCSWPQRSSTRAARPVLSFSTAWPRPATRRRSTCCATRSCSLSPR